MNKNLRPTFHTEPEESVWTPPSWLPVWLVQVLTWARTQYRAIGDLSNWHGRLALAQLIGAGAAALGLVVLPVCALIAYFFVYIAPAWAHVIWLWGITSLALIAWRELRCGRRIRAR
ncbi:MAG: hypothetical protein KDK78_10805 [Chlamydiia bacterium]|nr:hypothetical protein [Chlamydiia bacterium]